MKSRVELPATLALLGTLTAMSLVPLFLKYFTSYIDPWTANAIRYPVSALIYLPWIIHQHRTGILKSAHWRWALAPSLINVGGQVFWAWTPYYIDPGLMGFLIRLSTLWAVFGSFILFRDERRLIRDARFWTGFLLSVSGFILVINGGNRSLEGATAVGVGMIVLAGIFWAGYQLTVRRNLGTLKSPTAFGMVSILTSICLLGFMAAFGDPPHPQQLPLNVILLVVLSGIIGIAVSHLFLYYAIKRIGVAICSTAGLSSAFGTAFLSQFLFQEHLDQIQWTGGIILAAGAAFLIRSQTRLHAASPSSHERP